MGDWTFFSNHGHVFFCLARDGRARLRDVAADVGLTERAVQKIVKDLQQAGYIEVRKQGRCNRYRINRRKFLRHPLESHCSVSKLVNLVIPGSRAATASVPEPELPEPEVPEPEVPEPEVPEPEVPETEVPKPEIPEPEVPPPEVPQPVVPEPEEPQTVDEAEPATEPAERPNKPRKRSKRGKDESGPVDVRKQGSLF